MTANFRIRRNTGTHARDRIAAPHGSTAHSCTLGPSAHSLQRHGYTALDHLRPDVRHSRHRHVGLCRANCRRSHPPYRRVVFPVRHHRAGVQDSQFLSGAIHREAGRAGYLSTPRRGFARRFQTLPAERHGRERGRSAADSDVSALFQPRGASLPGEPFGFPPAASRLQPRRPATSGAARGCPPRATSPSWRQARAFPGK